MVTILLDPAHGGSVQHGKSTPEGRVLLEGSPEKATAWELASRASSQLGAEAQLTRHGDDNPSLAQRIAAARDGNARVFVSIHARPRSNGARGHETWIHTQGSEASMALARCVSRELTGQPTNGQVARGDLAVLTPDRHAPGTAACMVDVEVGVGADLTGIGDAIARAVKTYLGGGLPTGLGRRPTIRPLSVVTPAYQPQDEQQALQAFQQWQADANQFLIGVPPASHSIFPHSAVCHLQLKFSDGSSGGGTGFFIAEDLVLTAAHCLYDIGSGAYITSVDVFPGQANDTPVNSFTVSGGGEAFRVHPQYGGSASFDVGLIRAPGGKYSGPFFVLEEQNMSYMPGTVIVCGYAARLTAADMEVLRMCATIDRNVQHLSADTIQQLIENEQAFTYSLQTLAGTSGAPVFHATQGEVRAIGVHHGANDGTTNTGCRLTKAKIDWISGDWSGSQWPPAPSYGRRNGSGVRVAQPVRRQAYGRSAPALIQRARAFPQARGIHESYGAPAAARPRTTTPTRGRPALRPPYSRAQFGILKPPQYDPGNAQQSLDSLRLWQEELSKFLAGVPDHAHAFYPHHSICKFIIDGAGHGTGFWIGDGKILTAGHCINGVSNILISPGHLRNSTVWDVEVDSSAFRLYPGYSPAVGTDLGVIKLPAGHRFDELETFVLEDLNQCPSGGLVVCGYAAEITQEDMDAVQASFGIDPHVQHLSSGGFDLQGDDQFKLFSNITRGTSGSPVFYIGDDGAAHAVGVLVAYGDGTFNTGARLTQAAIDWIRKQ